MPLSEHEQRQLEQIEQSLYAEHPRLARIMRAKDPKVHYRRRVILAAIGFLAGAGMVVAGILLKYHWLSAAGFVVLVLSSVWAVTSYRKMTGIITGTRGGREGPRGDGNATEGRAEQWPDGAYRGTLAPPPGRQQPLARQLSRSLPVSQPVPASQPFLRISLFLGISPTGAARPAAAAGWQAAAPQTSEARRPRAACSRPAASSVDAGSTSACSRCLPEADAAMARRAVTTSAASPRPVVAVSAYLARSSAVPILVTASTAARIEAGLPGKAPGQCARGLARHADQPVIRQVIGEFLPGCMRQRRVRRGREPAPPAGSQPAKRRPGDQQQDQNRDADPEIQPGDLGRAAADFGFSAKPSCENRLLAGGRLWPPRKDGATEGAVPGC